MRLLLFVLLVITIVFAEAIGPVIHGQKDHGDPSWEQFTYSISVDCEKAEIRLLTLDAEIKRVPEVDAYLTYLDYSTSLISSGTSDENGFVVLKLPGKVEYMRGLFVLMMEKDGFRPKEIHFDISRCYSNETAHMQEAPEKAENITNPRIVHPAEEISNVTDVANMTAEEEIQAEKDICLGALSIFLILQIMRCV